MPADRVDTRSTILEAAERVIRDRGLSSATTKEIAREARCAEGSIYRYFEDKHTLMTEIIGSRYRGFFAFIESLPQRAGASAVSANLEEVARKSIDFYRGIVPMACGAIADRELLQQHREFFDRNKTGPMKFVRSLTEYLRREQRGGRVAEGVAPDVVAHVFLGSCFAHAFLSEFVGDGAHGVSRERFSRELVRTVLGGIEPEAPR
jgi:AcrR family transcriptional regulator